MRYAFISHECECIYLVNDKTSNTHWLKKNIYLQRVSLNILEPFVPMSIFGIQFKPGYHWRKLTKLTTFIDIDELDICFLYITSCL